MTITRRQVEVIVAVLVLVLLGFFLWWFLHRTPEAIEAQKQATKTLPTQSATTTDTAETPSTAVKQKLPPTAQTIGRSFVERFGSFSNESEYKNIQDVMSMATPALQTKLAALAEEAKKTANSGYYGISTTVISVKATSTTDTQVKLTITTLRSESIDSPANTTQRSEDIKLTLLKDGEDWLVDSYEWQ
jgi:hypothetical protein